MAPLTSPGPPLCNRCGVRIATRKVHEICDECDDVELCQTCFNLHECEVQAERDIIEY